MKELFKYFPKQIAFPIRVETFSFDEFMYLFNQYNMRKEKLYYSLYNCDVQGHFSDVKIDKIAFDFDSDKCVENILKLHKELQKRDLKHLMIFSTGGFWLYIFTKNYNNIINKKDCLANIQEAIAKKMNFKIALGEKGDICSSLIGDIARIARLPLSYDKGRGLYAIPVTEEDLKKGYDYIKEKAKSRVYDFVYYGENLLDISKYDWTREKSYVSNVKFEEIEYDVEEDELIKDFPQCIKNILMGKDLCSWENRYFFALFCREFGLSKALCDKIAKKYFSRVTNHGTLDGKGTNYDVWCKFRTLEYAYSRDAFFPSYKTMMQKGLCDGVNCKCKNGGVYR